MPSLLAGFDQVPEDLALAATRQAAYVALETPVGDQRSGTAAPSHRGRDAEYVTTEWLPGVLATLDSSATEARMNRIRRALLGIPLALAALTAPAVAQQRRSSVPSNSLYASAARTATPASHTDIKNDAPGLLVM